jgi:hypothetical protein
VATAFAQVYVDPFVKHIVHIGQVASVVQGTVRINGQDVDMYDMVVSSAEGPAPPANGVLSIIGKFFVNVAPATLDRIYVALRDANRVLIGEFEAHAVSDPVKIDSTGEYIVNIAIVVSAPAGVNVAIR